MGNDERLYSEVAKDRPLGDTPRTEEHGGPRLVDTRDAIQFESGSIAGDTPRTDPKPALVQNHDLRFPNAGELRKSGAKVPSKYKDSEVPGEYPLDTPRTDPEPALVRDYTPEGQERERVRATAAAEAHAAETGVDLASVKGSGLGGKVTKGDVEAAKGA